MLKKKKVHVRFGGTRGNPSLGIPNKMVWRDMVILLGGRRDLHEGQCPAMPGNAHYAWAWRGEVHSHHADLPSSGSRRTAASFGFGLPTS